MRFEDQVLARFADANPVPDEAALDELMRPTLELLEQGREEMPETKVRPIDPDRSIAKQERNRGLIFGVAAAILALVLGTATWIALAGSDDPTLEEAAEGGDPIAVIQVFHQKWSEGDIDGALAFVETPDDLTVQRSGMEYVIALEPTGWFWSVKGCAEQVPGAYRCDVALVGDPVIDALGLQPGQVEFRVEGNRLTGVGLPNYLQADLALSVHARAEDPDGLEAACTEAGEPVETNAGVVYNQACGAFLSQFLESFAAELTQP